MQNKLKLIFKRSIGLIIILVIGLLLHLYNICFISREFKFYINNTNDIISGDLLIKKGYDCYVDDSGTNYIKYIDINGYKYNINININVDEYSYENNDIFKCKVSSTFLQGECWRRVSIYKHGVEIKLSVYVPLFTFRLDCVIEQELKSIFLE